MLICVRSHETDLISRVYVSRKRDANAHRARYRHLCFEDERSVAKDTTVPAVHDDSADQMVTVGMLQM